MVSTELTTKPSPSPFDPLVPHEEPYVQDLTGSIIIPNPLADFIGAGGSAELYRLATHSGTLIAVKVLREFAHKKLDVERVQKRLNRELAAWIPLKHENIVHLLGTCTLPGKNLRAMCSEYYPNGNISEYLEDASRGTEKLILSQDVAAGLQYLHTCSPPLVHGDIKAANVLISDAGVARLIDFGLAKLVEELHVETGWTTTSFHGSTRWLSPELLLTDDEQVVTFKSDIWSFGCLLLEIFSGDLPYPVYKKDGAIVKAMINNELPVSECPVEITTDGLWLLMKQCWSTLPAERPLLVDVKSRLDRFVSKSGRSRKSTKESSS